MNMKFETHKTNKYKIHRSFHTTSYASTPLELLYILHEYLPKPIYHTHAFHNYQKAGNFETNNTLRV